MSATTTVSDTTSPSTVSPSTGTAARWTIDGSHSHVGFSIRHMMISNVRGELGKVSGDVTYDPARPQNTTLSVTIDVASIDTNDEKRDGHLKSADFFDAEKFPHITFVSKSVRAKGERLEIAGDLTIRGTTREVVLAVDDISNEQADPWGNRRIGATASTKISRADFGVTWNAALEAGGLLVGDEVKVSLEVELIKK